MLSCTAYSKGQVEKSYHKDNTFGIITLVFTMQIKESFNILISFHFISFHLLKYPGLRTHAKFPNFYDDENTLVWFSFSYCDHCIPYTLFQIFSVTSVVVMRWNPATMKLIYSTTSTIFNELKVSRITSIFH